MKLQGTTTGRNWSGQNLERWAQCPKPLDPRVKDEIDKMFEEDIAYLAHLEKRRREYQEWKNKRAELMRFMCKTKLAPHELKYWQKLEQNDRFGTKTSAYAAWLAKERYPDIYEKVFPRTKDKMATAVAVKYSRNSLLLLC